VKKAAFLVAILLLAACGTPREPPATTAADVEQLGPAPPWVREYCRRAARVVRSPVRCPGKVPAGLIPGENENVLVPSSTGYVFEGYTASHWVFGAFPLRSGLSRYGSLKQAGTARVRGHPARYLFASETSGIFAAHTMLVWRERGFVYAVSVHTGEPKRPPPRELLRIARGMRRF
jgi:hypothetical protein